VHPLTNKQALSGQDSQERHQQHLIHRRTAIRQQDGAPFCKLGDEGRLDEQRQADSIGRQLPVLAA
jgi:hypothetical protein